MDYVRVKEIVEPILKRHLGRFGYRYVDVIDGEDATGEQSIAIVVNYDDHSSGPEPRSSLEAELDVQRALFGQGETRTVHLMHYLRSDAEGMPSDA